MARRGHDRSEAVDGVLLLNKPAGLTSNQALQRVKRLLNARKAGHTGSLDPAATGMLPLCFGEATKVCAFLLDADKTYRVTAKLGSATDTGDATGSVIGTADVPQLTAEAWDAVLQGFRGESMQVPPMYSALKKDGKRLYELARKGETVERAPRPIRIDEIELLEAAGSRLVFRVRCSKGKRHLRSQPGGGHCAGSRNRRAYGAAAPRDGGGVRGGRNDRPQGAGGNSRRGAGAASGQPPAARPGAGGAAGARIRRSRCGTILQRTGHSGRRRCGARARPRVRRRTGFFGRGRGSSGWQDRATQGLRAAWGQPVDI